MAYFPAVMILGKLLFKNQVPWPLSFLLSSFSFSSPLQEWRSCPKHSGKGGERSAEGMEHKERKKKKI